MSDKPRIGWIGAGLMGHGAARNILERGQYPLAVMAHRNRAPIDDLVRRGAVEAADPAAVAAVSDVVFLCLPSSVEVKAVFAGPRGLRGALRSGMTVIDCTTADPGVTRRLGAELEPLGVALLDAALGRTPKEAEAGALSTYVGGDPAVIERVRPILACYADTIVVCGGLGAGATCKLVNNSITIGMIAVIAEALATAAKLGVDMAAQAAVLSAGGVDGRMWQVIKPWVLDGDTSHLKAPVRIGAKDIRYYTRMAEEAGVATFVAQAVNQTYRLVLNEGHAERLLPTMPGILAELNGARIRPLDP